MRVKEEVKIVMEEQTRLGLELIKLRKTAFELIPRWFRNIKLKSIKSKILRREVRINSYTILSFSEVKQTHYSEIPLKGAVCHEIIREYLHNMLFDKKHSRVYKIYQLYLRIREELYRRNINLIYMVMKNMKVSAEDWEDAFSYCQIAFLKAIDNWIPQKGAFSTYAYQWMVAAVQSYYREKQKNFAYSYNAYIREDEEETFEVFLKTTDDETGFDVMDALRRLPEEERIVIKRKFLEGYTEKEIAFMLGISPAKVGSIIRKGLKRMRNLLEGTTQ
ncbi:MAG: sigma-70 family RNA polymerase sigma factor [Nitrososphaerales archaeon]